VLLSTAELDHTLGLLLLREAESLAVYATAPVTEALSTVRTTLAAYTTVDWRVLECGWPADLTGGLVASVIPLGTKRPRYAAPADADDWVVAYEIRDRRTGGVLVYAPCLPAVTGALVAAVDRADVALLDGTFLTEDEFGTSATAMGHLPVEQTRRSLRGLYTHLNNTNPLVLGDPAVAADGQTFEL
jgi:pyrroloquinoline quinone biosynthesis protein B